MQFSINITLIATVGPSVCDLCGLDS